MRGAQRSGRVDRARKKLDPGDVRECDETLDEFTGRPVARVDWYEPDQLGAEFWWTVWESILIRGGWQRSEIHRTPADEVFAHIVHARRRESEERQWQLSAAVQPNRSIEDQRAVFQDAVQIGRCGAPRRKTPYDLVGRDDRIVMIGGELQVNGETWARRYPRQMSWLAEQGISRDEAIRLNEAWIKARL